MHIDKEDFLSIIMTEVYHRHYLSDPSLPLPQQKIGKIKKIFREKIPTTTATRITTTIKATTERKKENACTTNAWKIFAKIPRITSVFV